MKGGERGAVSSVLVVSRKGKGREEEGIFLSREVVGSILYRRGRGAETR